MPDHVASYAVAHVPGDGVGPEVTEVARNCVDAVAARRGFTVEWRPYTLGARHYLQTGEVLPDTALDELRKTDAVLLGAVGSPDVPPGVLERGLLLRLRAELDLYINLRPSKLRAGVANASTARQLGDLDLVIVRENTEGLYAGAGGTVHRGTEFETATEESLNTWAGVRRCVRYAAELAAGRSGRLTLVHKTNVLTHAGDLWQRVAVEVAAEYGVELSYAHVDAACLYLVDDPARFDVIVTDNLFGDILSDLGAALTGGLGLAPSGNLNPDRTGPSVFEPVHGSAPDIAGQGLANPAGAVLSAGLMLAHLGQPEAAGDLDAAVSAVLAAGAPAGTAEWDKALQARLGGAGEMAGEQPKRKVEIYDTTLRDGSQQVGLDLTVADKIRVATVLDSLGVDVIEGGWPGSNPKDAEFFARAKSLRFTNAQLAAFGATRLPRRGVDDDANLAALLAAETPIVTLVGKAWTLHVAEALRTTREENLAMVAESVGYMTAAGRRVVFDAEHFFDGYLADRGYALEVLAAAAGAGADTLALCDTNGGTLPDDVAAIVAEVADRSPALIGVHFHNDAACAVANSVVAVAAGGLHVQGAANGYGERCGNADLFSVIASLELKRGHELLPPGRLAALASTARTIADVANLPFEARQPYVGGSAFATKAGLHASAIARRPDAYSHIEPAAVGNQAQVLVSELAGRSNVMAKAAELGLDLSADPGLAGRVLDQVKEAEHRGYAFEAADASFELLVRRSAGVLATWFELEGYRVVIERASAQDRRQAQDRSEAIVRLRLGADRVVAVGEGVGPVHALDQALRRALVEVYPALAGIRLVDYKVRILDGRAATSAVTRVMLTSADDDGEWTTVGVSDDVVTASWEALADGVAYGLLRAGATAIPDDQLARLGDSAEPRISEAV